jgi:hypothetical protein
VLMQDFVAEWKEAVEEFVRSWVQHHRVKNTMNEYHANIVNIVNSKYSKYSNWNPPYTAFLPISIFPLNKFYLFNNEIESPEGRS